MMLKTLLGGGLLLAISIHIFKNKTGKCHVGAECLWMGVFSVAEFGFGFSVGAGCYACFLGPLSFPEKKASVS